MCVCLYKIVCQPAIYSSSIITATKGFVCKRKLHELQDIMASFILVTAVLVASSIALSTAHDEDTDLLVLTTAHQLRKEIRSQLTETLPELCTCDCQSYGSGTQPSVEYIVNAIEKLESYVKDGLKESVNNTATDVLTQLLFNLSHLLIPGLSPCHPATSCKEILQLDPHSPSGLYWIRGTDGASKHMYCDMERSCKGVGGGWMRVASVDMTDSSNSCPSGLRTLTEPRRLCAKNINGAGCSSAVLPVEGVQYSRVCGKIIGYQQKTPDAFVPYHRGQRTIDSRYVDGISLTYGRSPRKHIWTFVIAVDEYNSRPNNVCPCTNTRNTNPPAVPPFVGHDYFCDTGSENHYQHIFYGADPLWDGEGCGQFSTCCSWNNPPWFMKEISPTTDDIEMRLCCDQPRSDEDVTFETLEIYVQ